MDTDGGPGSCRIAFIMALTPGQKLGPYEIVAPLGGAGGDVGDDPW
jgi:hypothetical protein